MKTRNFFLLSLSVCSIATTIACNSNRSDEKQLDTIYEHTDPEGHPLDNKDTVVEYKEIDSLNRDTSLRGDKH